MALAMSPLEPQLQSSSQEPLPVESEPMQSAQPDWAPYGNAAFSEDNEQTGRVITTW